MALEFKVDVLKKTLSLGNHSLSLNENFDGASLKPCLSPKGYVNMHIYYNKDHISNGDVVQELKRVEAFLKEAKADHRSLEYWQHTYDLIIIGLTNASVSTRPK